ncbi:hypothetical protein MVES1_000057 [Malassezia vespertilionis]|uniref:Uncharacterized protein n=1 Tax=Malassezia vespertilionis TaxID=2020962 RepID=A0A2N1JFV1_9BASI|nr:uncharacterized protein MVES1_000057 [Malassezia vespertilionis]PKI85415.1 hypothetical protein MVES_000053 [Malassezia vespertilionis]WFD04733.1 hypothetical protein MVES1_000057 [Malassezia vespertilionis]
MSEDLPAYTRQPTRGPAGWSYNYRSPNGAPPSYSDSVRWFFHNSLRPAFLAFALVSAIVAVFLAAIHWRDMADMGENAKILLAVSAALFTAVAIIQTLTFTMGVLTNLKGLRIAVRVIFLSTGMASAAQSISLTNIYSNKDEIIAHCVNSAGSSALAEFRTEMSTKDSCTADWDSDAAWNIAWLVIVILFCILYSMICSRYLAKVESAVPGATNAPLSDNARDDWDVEQGCAMGSVRPSIADDVAIEMKANPMADVYGGRSDSVHPAASFASGKEDLDDGASMSVQPEYGEMHADSYESLSASAHRA